jgi:hypothetical protein
MAWYLLVCAPKSAKQILVGTILVGHMVPYYWFFIR